MKLDTLKYGFDSTTMPSDSLGDYWSPEVTAQLAEQDWAMTSLRDRLDLPPGNPSRRICERPLRQSTLEAHVVAGPGREW